MPLYHEMEFGSEGFASPPGPGTIKLILSAKRAGEGHSMPAGNKGPLGDVTEPVIVLLDWLERNR